MEDRELVDKTRQGDREAFVRLVERHLRPCFGLALALVRDEGEAEELVQEAVVLSWEGLARLEDPARFGAWFAGIVRRGAARRARSIARGRRAAAAWSEEARRRDAPTGEERMERAEALSQLRARIDELPETLRVPLVLYYFEDRSAARAAERLGLTPATFRKRLQLARDRLRDALERDLERTVDALEPRPEFQRSLRALVFALPAAPLVPVASSATATTVGGLLMKKVLVAIAVVIACVGSVLWWWDDPTSVPGRETRVANSDAAEEPPTRARATARPSPTKPESPPEAGSSTAASDENEPRLQLRVVGPTNDPVPDAWIHIVAHGKATPPVGDETHRYPTDAQGRAVTDRLAAGNYDVIVRADRFELRRVEDVRVDIDTPRSLVIRLTPGLDISGVVLGSDDTPVVGAIVRVKPRRIEAHLGHQASIVVTPTDTGDLDHLEATTDREGRFRVTGLQPGRFDLQTLHDLHPNGRAENVAAGTEDVVVRLARGGTLVGRVSTPEGGPVAGATIRLADLTRQTVSDAHGHFTFPGLAQSSSRLEIIADGYPLLRPDLPPIEPGTTTELIDFVLSAGARIVGTVVDDSGAGLPDVRVRAYATLADGPIHPWNETRADVRTAGDGSFDLCGLETDSKTAVLVFEHPGSLELRLDTPIAAGRTIDLGEVVLDPGEWIEGVVLDDSGAPVPRAEVHVGSAEGKTEPTEHADDEGRFRIGPYAVGDTIQLDVRVHGLGTVRHRIEAIPEGGIAELEIIVGRGPRLAGRVTDDLDTPLAGVTVRAMGETESLAVSGPDGRFELRGLDSTPHTVEVDADGHVATRHERVEPGTVDLRLVLDREVTLVGRVTDRLTREPVPQFALDVLPADSAPTPDAPRVSPDEAKSFASPYGEYFLAGLPAGRCQIRVTARGYAPTLIPVDLSPGETREIDVVLDRGRTVSSQVVDESGRPIAGVKVRRALPPALEARFGPASYATVILGKGGVHAFDLGQSRWEARTDDEARFTLEDCPSEPFEILFSDDRYLDTRISSRDLEPDSEPIVLREGAGIEGRITLPDGTPCAGGLIGITSDAIDLQGRIPTSIDADGRYRITGLTRGDYRLTFRLLLADDPTAENGFRTVSTKIAPIGFRLREERVTNYDLELSAAKD